MIHRSVECDVMVCGGGPAGVSASIAAARAGASVVLCQNRSVLGGNASSEIRMHIVGADANGFRNGFPMELEAREGGIIEELRLRQAVENPTRSPHGIDTMLYEMVRNESRIRLLLDTHVTGTHVEGCQIVEAHAVRPAHEESFVLRASQFVDASGDSRMAVSAGNPFRCGREARSEFQETHARPVADREVLGSTVLFQSKKLDHPVPFTAPAWARKVTEDDLRNRPHSLGSSAGGEECGYEYGFWWLEWGGHLDTIRDGDAIRSELLSIALGIWDHLKNGGAHGAENYALTWVGMLPGKRESRRLIGQKTLTEHDVLGARSCEDAIAYGGWPMDLHPPRGVDSPDDPPCTQIEVPHLYPIPLGACRSAALDNLWFAGRNISATHVAFASTRVMATCCAVGQGVGIAAAHSAIRGFSGPAEVDIPAIQQEILKQDGFLIGIRNEDPADLARRATAEADSEQKGCEATRVLDGFTRTTHHPRGTREGTMPPGMHRWCSQGLPATLRLSWPSPVAFNVVHLVFDTGLHRPLTLTQSDAVHSRYIWGPQPETVKAYRLMAETETGDHLLAVVKDNFLRLRIHHFLETTARALRVEVAEANGIAHARICEVRCYLDNPFTP